MNLVLQAVKKLELQKKFKYVMGLAHLTDIHMMGYGITLGKNIFYSRAISLHRSNHNMIQLKI